jgi:hypothetical protein
MTNAATLGEGDYTWHPPPYLAEHFPILIYTATAPLLMYKCMQLLLSYLMALPIPSSSLPTPWYLACGLRTLFPTLFEPGQYLVVHRLTSSSLPCFLNYCWRCRRTKKHRRSIASGREDEMTRDSPFHHPLDVISPPHLLHSGTRKSGAFFMSSMGNLL